MKKTATTKTTKTAKASPAINGQCECHLIALVVEPTVKLTKTQKANSGRTRNGLVRVHYHCDASTDRRFAPGHDARYHGIEALAARLGISPVYYTEDDLPRSMR